MKKTNTKALEQIEALLQELNDDDLEQVAERAAQLSQDRYDRRYGTPDPESREGKRMIDLAFGGSHDTARCSYAACKLNRGEYMEALSVGVALHDAGKGEPLQVRFGHFEEPVSVCRRGHGYLQSAGCQVCEDMDAWMTEQLKGVR